MFLPYSFIFLHFSSRGHCSLPQNRLYRVSCVPFRSLVLLFPSAHRGYPMDYSFCMFCRLCAMSKIYRDQLDNVDQVPSVGQVSQLCHVDFLFGDIDDIGDIAILATFAISFFQSV